MHYVERRPAAPLRPWVEKLWALSDAPAHTRERILPNGTLELVINLHEDEFRIYHEDYGAPSRQLGGAIVSGTYDRFFGIDTREHASIVGVHFKPAGASAVLGVPARQLFNTHVELHALWGQGVGSLRDRLCSAPRVADRFDIIEAALREHLAPPRQHPAIAFAIAQLEHGAPVAHVASQLAFSHRRLIEAFGAAVGLSPKAFARVRRFQRVLAHLRRSAPPNWCELAVQAGYCDQSHLIRDFMAFSGLPPKPFLRASAVPVKEHHIALPPDGA